MTLEQTRQLGIEFERRVLAMIPETEFYQKLDTETIYSFLNQYLDKLIHDTYKQLDQIESPSKISQYTETLLQGLLSYSAISVTAKDGIFSVDLPNDFGLYVNSTTRVSKTYSLKNTDKDSGASGIIPNVLVSLNYANYLMTRPQDSMRIMRQPIAYLSCNRTIEVMCDRYTTPTVFGLTYYRIPRYMNLMTSAPCELSMDVFETLVSGAVDMYILYAVGAESRRRHQREQELLQQLQQSKNERE